MRVLLIKIREYNNLWLRGSFPTESIPYAGHNLFQRSSLFRGVEGDTHSLKVGKRRCEAKRVRKIKRMETYGTKEGDIKQSC